jgi:hypothetical protein
MREICKNIEIPVCLAEQVYEHFPKYRGFLL